MNLRLTNAALVWTILSGATAAMICACPAAADSVDQIENPAQVELRQVRAAATEVLRRCHGIGR